MGTLAELKAAKINRKAALGIGIAVDPRRVNRSEESFRANVERLKMYKSKLVVFPRKPTSKKHKRGGATREQCKAVQQVLTKGVFAISQPKLVIKAREATRDEREQNAFAIVRKARTDAKFWGQRAKRAKAKEEKAKQAALKKRK